MGPPRVLPRLQWMTDDTETAERTAPYVRCVLALLNLITLDWTEQAAALITQATVVIENEVGTAAALACSCATKSHRPRPASRRGQKRQPANCFVHPAAAGGEYHAHLA